MTVVEASAIIDLPTPPDRARRDLLVRHLPEPVAPWLAPEIPAFKVFAVMRRHVVRAALSAVDGGRALRGLLRLPIDLVPSTSLLLAAWPLRDRFSAADSLYAALALSATGPLLTSDLRLARAATSAAIEVRAPT